MPIKLQIKMEQNLKHCTNLINILFLCKEYIQSIIWCKIHWFFTSGNKIGFIQRFKKIIALFVSRRKLWKSIKTTCIKNISLITKNLNEKLLIKKMSFYLNSWYEKFYLLFCYSEKHGLAQICIENTKGKRFCRTIQFTFLQLTQSIKILRKTWRASQIAMKLEIFEFESNVGSKIVWVSWSGLPND